MKSLEQTIKYLVESKNTQMLAPLILPFVTQEQALVLGYVPNEKFDNKDRVVPEWNSYNLLMHLSEQIMALVYTLSVAGEAKSEANWPLYMLLEFLTFVFEEDGSELTAETMRAEFGKVFETYLASFLAIKEVNDFAIEVSGIAEDQVEVDPNADQPEAEAIPVQS